MVFTGLGLRFHDHGSLIQSRHFLVWCCLRVESSALTPMDRDRGSQDCTIGA